ncbi:MAG: class B sortase [Oscillospiraceae bacterium]|jgi:sortase B|nr:class B sortase [Oscillospiraceae bacterium]
MKREESKDALEAMESVLEASGPKLRKKNFFEKNFLPLKTDSKREKRRKIIFDIAVFVMFISVLVLLWFYVIDPGIAKSKSAKLQGIHGDAIVDMTTPDGGYIQAPAEAEQRRLTYTALKARNPEYVGWLSIPGASVELPVVQTGDNKTYLKKDFDRMSSNYGNPFLDYRNSQALDDANLIIYGHHMHDGKIFASLTNYETKATLSKYPIISLELEDATLRYKIVAVLKTNGSPQEDNGYVFHFDTPNFKSEENFNGYVEQLKQRTLFYTSTEGVDIQYGDRLLSIQTCLYQYENEFLVIVGRLLREGEDPNIPADQVHHNPNIRYAQAWYNKYNKGVNPWKNKERWYP